MAQSSTILIVDDTPAGREALKGVLMDQGYELILAENGAQALERAARQVPDLILLDVMMPEMDGLEVCRRLRSDPRTAEVPVIMVTALDDRKSKVQGLEVGADDFISKPFDRVELRARVRTITKLNRYRRLLAERAKVDSLVTLSPDGIAVVDSSGRIHLANPALERLLGLEPGGADGASLWALIDPGHQDECAQCFRQVMQNRETHEMLETTLLRADGARVAVEVSAGYCLWDERPSAELIIRDITERKLLEGQLRQSQKLETIGQFTTGIAHDFNNILSIVLTNAELLAPALSPEAQEHSSNLDDIVAAARSGATMIRKLLGLSRRADLHLEPTDLGLVVGDLSSMLRRLLPENIEPQFTIGESLPTVRADTGAVQQMVMNLVTNARDAMPDGGSLRIELTPAERDDRPPVTGEPGSSTEYLCVRVSDTGAGMDAETKAKIFEPFFTTKELGKGTGLGMPMILGLMEQHKGIVDVASEIGQGTTVSLYFPIIEKVATSASGLVPGRETRGGTETILVAEDEEPLRRAARRALESFGYQVLVAADGADALRVFKESKADIDLIISDLSMPKLSGLELYRRVRQEAEGVKFLFSTGYAGSDFAERLDQEVGVQTLQKPWTLTELAARVRETLDAEPAS